MSITSPGDTNSMGVLILVLKENRREKQRASKLGRNSQALPFDWSSQLLCPLAIKFQPVYHLCDCQCAHLPSEISYLIPSLKTAQDGGLAVSGIQ